MAFGKELSKTVSVTTLTNISIKRSDFEDLFRRELSRDSILSIYFRHILLTESAEGYICFHSGDDADLKYSIKNLTAESKTRDEYNFSIANNWLSIILTELMRKYYLDMEMEPAVYGDKFSHILRYIHDNYQSVTLERLCKKFNYTKPYLCFMFKNNTGKTFSNLINIQRTQAASTLLDESDYSVDEIAFKVGYNSADYFSRSFKKIYGLSPTAYRLKIHSTN